MRKQRRRGSRTGVPGLLDQVPPTPTPEDELEAAVELLSQQEPSEVRPFRADPSTPTDDADPALIDPAD